MAAALTTSFSANRDGGVRLARIAFKLEHWDIVPVLPWRRASAWTMACDQIGAPYDDLGVLFNFTVPLRRDLRRSWFCSELCAWALGLAAPATLSPGDLYLRIHDLNAAFRAGQGAQDKPL